MNRVNVVIVKMVVFFVLFGGMLLGVTTSADAAPAGCSPHGHVSCGYDTLALCTPDDPAFRAFLYLPKSGHWNGCLDCNGDGICHRKSGDWKKYTCGIVTILGIEGAAEPTFTVGQSWVKVTGVKCN